MFAKQFQREEDVRFVLDSLKELWTIDLQGGDLHFAFKVTEMALTGKWDFGALRAEKDVLGRSNFDPGRPAQAWRAKVTFLREHLTSWYKDAVGAFHDCPHVPVTIFPTPNDDTKTFDYDTYIHTFNAFIEANAAVDAEARKQNALVRGVVRPLLLLLEAQHWAEFEVQHVLRKRFVPALIDAGHDNYARLMPTLELNFHLRSPLANALNSSHIQHSVSGIPGGGFSGDHLQEDHVHQVNSIAPKAVRVRDYAARMSTRSLAVGMRRWLLRTLARRDWAGLSLPSTKTSSTPSVAVEVGLLARAMERARINRPDEARTKLRYDGLGNFLRCTVFKVDGKCTISFEGAPCFAHVYAGLQAVLVAPDVLIAGDVLRGQALPEGAMALGYTVAPVGTSTGGGGDFRIVDGEATGFVWLPCSLGPEEAVLSVGRAPSQCLRLAPWPTQGTPVGLCIRWDGLHTRDRSVADVLPASSVITAVGGRSISSMLSSSAGTAMPLAAVADAVLEALRVRTSLCLARAQSIGQLCTAALREVIDGDMPSLKPSGGRWLWLYHPSLKPSPIELTGFPKSRVPSQVGVLVEAVASADAEAAAEAELPASAGARQRTTERCHMCHRGAGACARPGEPGHLALDLAHCEPCSGKTALKRPELRVECKRCGAPASKGSRPHWPAESLQPTLCDEVVELGGLPLAWMRQRQDASKAAPRTLQKADAERDLAVSEFLHAADAKKGAASDPVQPGGKPGRPGAAGVDRTHGSARITRPH